ncbi:MAG: hypothetical protein RLY21_2145 [Planctomycetota bacterium]|jgi:hypothetical protein
MDNPGRSESDRERNFYAGAPSGDGSSKLVVAIAGLAAFLCAWTIWSQGTASMTRSAEAGPPPSALNMQKEQVNEERARALDSGIQREQLISEIKQLRYEVASIKDLIKSGQIRAEVSSFADLKREDIKLEIDYAKLREALRQP